MSGGWTDEQVALVRKLAAEGHSSGKIVRELRPLRPDVTRNGVVGACHRHGITLTFGNRGPAKVFRKKPTPPPERAALPKPTSIPSATPRNRKYEGTHEHVVQKIVAPPPADPVRAHAFDPLPGVTPLPLMQRRASQCAWPVGEPPTPSEQLCCGAPAASMEADAPPYCGAHMAMRRGKPWRQIKIGRVT